MGKRLHRTRGGFHRCIHISKVLCALDRAVEFLKRVADPDDPYTYCDARHAMRPRKSEKGLRKDRKRAKKPTVAKNKKSA